MAEVPRFLPPSEVERRRIIAGQMTPRSRLGATRDIQPVVNREVGRAGARSLASGFGASQSTDTFEDIFTLAAAGAQTQNLTFLPIGTRPEDVKLNGVGQTRGVDWSRAGQTLSVLAAMDARAGDELKCQYTHLLSISASPGADPTVRATAAANAGVSGNYTISLVIPASVAGGDQLYAAVSVDYGGVNTSSVATPVGWTLLASSSTASGVGDSIIYLFTRIATAGDAGSTVGFAVTLGAAGNGISHYGMAFAAFASGTFAAPTTTTAVASTFTIAGSGVSIAAVGVSGVLGDGYFTVPTGATLLAGAIEGVIGRAVALVQMESGGSRLFTTSPVVSLGWVGYAMSVGA